MAWSYTNVPGVTNVNGLKTAVGSKLGTREIQFVTVAATQANGSTAVAFQTNSTDSNSEFSKAVRALQGFGELYVIGTPASDTFIVGMSADTANSGSAAGAADGSYGAMEAAIVAALAYGSSSTATVADVAISGATFA